MISASAVARRTSRGSVCCWNFAPTAGQTAPYSLFSYDAFGQMVQRDRLDVIRRSGGLLLAVLNDVLDLSKIEAGKLTLFEEDFDVEAAIGQARENFQLMADAKNLDFKVEVAEAARGWWRGDADRLRQIVGNLLSNAVKFTPSGGRIVVRVHADDEMLADPRVFLAVSDTGPGIPPDKLGSDATRYRFREGVKVTLYGAKGQYLNATVELQTDLSPPDLLHELLDIEGDLGRVRAQVDDPQPLARRVEPQGRSGQLREQEHPARGRAARRGGTTADRAQYALAHGIAAFLVGLLAVVIAARMGA